MNQHLIIFMTYYLNSKPPLIIKYQMTTIPEQHHILCNEFITKCEMTNCYTSIREILLEWKRNNKPTVGFIDTFMDIADVIRKSNNDGLIESLNKILVKNAAIPLKAIPSKNTRENVKDAARMNSNCINILDSVQNLFKGDNRVSQVLSEPIKLNEVTQKEIFQRVDKHPFGRFIFKVIHLYLKCIISLSQFRKLLASVSTQDQQLYRFLNQIGQDIQLKRRKTTIFAPLNQLVDQRYPVQQIGNSYIKIPDGYANYGKNWCVNKCQYMLNRKYVSVPLGQEGSFIISRKNQFEQQLFENQSEKYEIDLAIQHLKIALKQASKQKNIESTLLQNVLTRIYPSQNLYDILKQYPEIAQKIIIPRLQQKLQQILIARKKFEKPCIDIASKNFERSLDYRCFYFRKNDKKFNGQARYEKEIKMKQDQLLGNHDGQQLLEDRQSLHNPRNFAINTFENITKQNFIQNTVINLEQFDRKKNVTYPKYPDNQILFILNFGNRQVLNDVLQILLYHCSKKNLLELAVFKIFKFNIQCKLQKDINLLKNLQNKGQGQSVSENDNSNIGGSYELLNQKKDRKVYKDINEEFIYLIEEQVEPTSLQNIESPFEGPDEHNFIATKPIYLFLRYLLTIYQRFLRAKQVTDKDGDLYGTFLTILIFKLKDVKYSDLMRTIFKKDAFIFLTLDKIIGQIVKLFTNINGQSLTYKILKQNTKDYEMQIKKWDDFKFPSAYEQLVRVYEEKQMLFRFSYSKDNIFVSAWNNTQPDSQSNADSCKKHKIIQVSTQKRNFKKVWGNLSNVIISNNSQYISQKNSNFLIFKGQQLIINKKRQNACSPHKLQKQLCKFKKVKLN